MKNSGLLVFVVLFASACGGTPESPPPNTDAGSAGVDAGAVDAGVADAGAADAGAADAGAADAGAADAGAADAGAVDAGAVDAGVVDAGAVDAGVVDAGLAPPTYAGFAQAFAAGYCARLFGCGSFTESPPTLCETYYTARVADGFLGVTAAAVSSGRAHYDRPAADVCLRRFSQLDHCGVPFECELVGVGVVSDGGVCEADDECASTAEQCLGSSRCGRTCTVVRGLGQPCSTRFPPCHPGLYCDNAATRTCLAIRDAGPCPNGTECDPASSFCDNGSCSAFPGANQNCNGAPRCADGFYCLYDAGVGTCAPNKGLNEPCDRFRFDESCGPGLYCTQRLLCEPSVPPGGLCDEPYECEHFLACDTVLQRCVQGLGSVAVGGECTGSNWSCHSGARCVGAFDNPDGGAGDAGICRLNQLGDECSPGGLGCGPTMTCNTNPGPDDAGNPRSARCEPHALGTVCESGDTCFPGGFCDFSAFPAPATCQLEKTLGQSCVPGDRCTFPLSCLPTGTFPDRACGLRPDLGQPCDPTFFGCRTGTGCSPIDGGWGVCVELLRIGTPCSDQCLEGACASNPDGGRNLCSPVLLPDGAACTVPTACASGHCSAFDSQCHQACF